MARGVTRRGLMRAAGLAALPCSSGAAPVGGSILPTDLRCELLTDPLGIDAERPRLSWSCAAADPRARGLRQSAWHIRVASSREALARGEGDLWDSGRVASDESLHVR